MQLNRRQFLVGCASGLVLAGCGSLRTQPRATTRSSFDGMGELRTTYDHELIVRMRDSGVRAITVTVSDPKFTGSHAIEDGMAALQDHQAFVAGHGELLMVATRAADIDAAISANRIAVFYLFQNSTPFGEDLENVARFKRAGLSSCQVTYNDCNPSGCGSRVADGHGLTDFGRSLVSRMNQERILVDTAHANMATMLDVIRTSTSPTIISHTGCSTVYPSYRNTTDENLRALAQRGGVVGIYQIRPFLTDRPSSSALGMYFEHIKHAVQVCGFEGVAIGSDRDHRFVTMTPEYIAEVKREEGPNFHASDWPLFIDELNGPSRMEVVWDGLRSLGFSESNCDRIMMGNLHRLYRDVLG